jgi:hypothetical protein
VLMHQRGEIPLQNVTHACVFATFSGSIAYGG